MKAAPPFLAAFLLALPSASPFHLTAAGKASLPLRGGWPEGGLGRKTQSSVTSATADSARSAADCDPESSRGDFSSDGEQFQMKSDASCSFLSPPPSSSSRRRLFGSSKQKNILPSSSPSPLRLSRLLFSALLLPLFARPGLARAMGSIPKPAAGAPALVLTGSARLYTLLTFLGLFTVLALFHSAEIAITTLYPWKVREFAEEEGPNSPFAILDGDITRVLTTILVTSTTCSIYATTVFARLASSAGPLAERYAAVVLTILTLFFVELLPKSVGVSNAELVARKCIGPIMVLAKVVSPVGLCLNYLAKRTLALFGLQSKSISDVSEEELRLIVSGARDSGSIESTEGDMIQGVLNLQDQKVKEIMMPRVEIVAVPKDMSVANVLGVVRESG